MTDAEASPHLAELPLADLRTYRQRLRDEEEKISYWRRLVHARIDLVRAGTLNEGPLSLNDLVRVLGDTGSGEARSRLVGVRASEALPALPQLDEVWSVPDTEADVEGVLSRLSAAEEQLTQYRRALHERIDEATGELIARYRDDPTGSLSALTS